MKDEPAEGVGIVLLRFPGEHHRPPLRQRHKGLHNKHVEAHRGHGKSGELSGVIAHAVGKVEQRAVAYEHPLGFSRGSGGVDDVSRLPSVAAGGVTGE